MSPSIQYRQHELASDAVATAAAALTQSRTIRDSSPIIPRSVIIPPSLRRENATTGQASSLSDPGLVVPEYVPEASWPRPRAVGQAFSRSPILVDELDVRHSYPFSPSSPPLPPPSFSSPSLPNSTLPVVPRVIVRRTHAAPPSCDADIVTPRPVLEGRLSRHSTSSSNLAVDDEAKLFHISPFVAPRPRAPTLVLSPAAAIDNDVDAELAQELFDLDAQILDTQKLLRAGSWEHEEAFERLV